MLVRSLRPMARIIHPAVTATRALSAVPEGHNEKMMFALGLSMGLRTGAEVKDVLNKDELEHLAAGFTAHMTGSLGEQGELAVLQEVCARIYLLLPHTFPHTYTHIHPHTHTHIHTHSLTLPRALRWAPN